LPQKVAVFDMKAFSKEMNTLLLPGRKAKSANGFRAFPLEL